MSVKDQVDGAKTECELLLRELATRRRDVDPDRACGALNWATEQYAGKKHWTGLNLLEHTKSVLTLFLAFEPDEPAIIACILHHILDENRSTLDDVQRRYGPEVRMLVGGAHLLSHVTMENRRMSLEQLRSMFLEVSDDLSVILLTLCDKTSSLDSLDGVPAELRRRVSRDALSVFAPVASRLGIYSIKNALEAGAFPVLYPTDAEHIDEQMAQIHARYGDFLEAVALSLMQFLAKGGVVARIEGREKQPYSIFRKMQSKSISHIGELYDLFAFRVIVQSEAMCYQALGLLHRIGHPVTQRFKDYIAFPKPNGYQSLHTTLTQLQGLPEKVAVEVQVRTEAMHREAEFGFAAHWTYKETVDPAEQRRKISEALGFQQAIERGKTRALHDHIFVLTPKGDIIELPDGATPLDFAFHVHTDLGLSFRGARVNGATVPITYQLQNGDIVEILRYRDPHPSPRWSTLLKTASARTRLRRYLSERGTGGFLLDDVPDVVAPVLRKPEMPVLKKKKDPRPLPARSSAVRMEGDVQLPVRFAKCCNPQKAKTRGPLIGVVTRQGKVNAHAAACKLAKNATAGRRIGVFWA